MRSPNDFDTQGHVEVRNAHPNLPRPGDGVCRNDPELPPSRNSAFLMRQERSATPARLENPFDPNPDMGLTTSGARPILPRGYALKQQ